MADESKPVAPSLAVLLWAIAGRIFQREALMMVASTVTLLVAGGVGVVYAQGKGAEVLDAGIDAKLAPLKERQDDLDGQLRGLAAQQAGLSAKLEAKEERDAKRFDLLYQVILTGKPSSAAEALGNASSPLARDGGP